MVFIATTHEYEAGVDKEISSGTPYCCSFFNFTSSFAKHFGILNFANRF